MALRIVEGCINCRACETVCPQRAIVEAKPRFRVDAARCTGCLGEFAEAQCAAICPVEGAIVDELNEPLNPPGSLTGIPPARRAAVQAEIAAR